MFNATIKKSVSGIDYIGVKSASLPHFVQTLRNAGSNNAVMSGNNSSAKENRDGWSGTDTLEEAYRLAVEGWREPLERIKRDYRAAAATDGFEPRRASLRADVVGCLPLVSAALAGLPCAMLRDTTKRRKSRTLEIYYAPTANWDTTAEELIKAGIVVLTLINGLERSGYSCRLVAVNYIADAGNERLATLVTIKDYRAPLDLAKVAFPLASPAFLRRLGFRALETLAEIKASGWSGGYGHSITDRRTAESVLHNLGFLGDDARYFSFTDVKRANYNPATLARAVGIEL